jgi:tetratricopeptide (TPR) repeat protein
MIDSATIERFSQYLRALSAGHESALSGLADQSDPESLRRRSRHLLDLGRTTEAINLLQDRPLDIEWSEQFLRAQVRSGMLDAALKTIQWTNKHASSTHAARARLIAAVEAIESTHTNTANFNELPILNLPDDDRGRLEFARDLCLQPANEVLDAGGAKNTLERLFCVTALRMAATLGDQTTLVSLATAIEKLRPFPIELGHLANAGLVDAKSDWSARIRSDYTAIDAHVVAAVLEARHFGRARTAFEQLLTKVETASGSSELHNLYFGLREISQYLGDAETRLVNELASRLLGDSRELLAFTTVEGALMAGQSAVAEKLLDDWKDPQNPVWIQLTAQLLIQKRELAQAIDLLSASRKEHTSPAVLMLLAQAAFRSDRYEVAREALETLLKIRPNDAHARRNLAMTLLRLQDKPSALPVLRQLLKDDPGNDGDVLLYAQCLIDLSDTTTSISVLSEFLSVKPTSRDARLLLAYALEGVGRPKDAFDTLQSVQQHFQDDPQFQFAYFEAASRAGRDLDAHNAMQVLLRLREAGKVSEKALWQTNVSEVVEYSKSFNEGIQKAGQDYLQGKLPWVALAEMERNSLLWAWFLRTQKLQWLAERPNALAEYSVYSTNSFTVLRSDSGNALIDIEAADFGSTIALDVSALITIWELDLFDQFCASYDRILLPSLYLERATGDRPRLLPHQLSQRTTVQDIHAALDARKVGIWAETDVVDDTQLSEYSDAALWRLANVQDALRTAGLLTQEAAQRLSRISHRPPSPTVLRLHTSVLVELHTLRTLTSEHLLELLTDNWKVFITAEARDEIAASVRAFDAQNKVFDSHDMLWKRVRASASITLVPPKRSLTEESDDADDRVDRTPILGVALALENQIPVLADDRFSQQLVLNARGESQSAAFGTDQWLIAMMSANRIDSATVAKAFLNLMEWRYKFLMPTTEMLLAIANQYPDVVPNSGLRTVARYVHACMRDAGLYIAPEPVIPPVSVGLRLYSRWVLELAQFAATIWGSPEYTEQYAQNVTSWITREALPAPAHTMGSAPTADTAWDTRRHFLKYFASSSLAFRDNDRMAHGFSAVREALQFTDLEYVDCLSEVISRVSTSDFSPGADASTIASAQLAFLKQLSHRAFSHKAQWPSPLYNELVIARIVVAQPGSDDPNLAEILANPKHSLRAYPFPSPVLVYRDGENSYSVADLTGLFLSTDVSVRSGAALESRRLFQFLGLPENDEVSGALTSVGQLDEMTWRVAATRLRQAFDREFLIVGFAYVHYEHINVDAFIPDRVKAAFSDSLAVRAFVHSIHERTSVTAVPFQGEERRTVRHDWEIVDFLAGTEAHRLGRSLNAPGSVLEQMKAQFITSADGTAEPWGAITSLVSLFRDEPDARVRPLADLERIARHYIRLLECTFPSLSQASVANAAWTMSNFLLTVNRLFPSTPNPDVVFASARDLVDEYRAYWQYSKPVLSTNTAYALTLSSVPPISADFLDMLGEAISNGSPPDQSLWPLITAFVAHMLVAVAASETSPDGPLFGRVSGIAKDWITVVPDQSMSTDLSEIQSTLSEPATKEILIQRYREFPERATVTNDASLQLILTGAKRGQLTANDLVEVWQDADWRARLARAELSVVQTAIAVCLGALQPHSTDIGVTFCHLLAELALTTRGNADRFKQLASTLVVACVRTNTTSAVERLVSKCRGTEAIPLIQDATEFLESHSPGAPPWIAGRMRAVLASVAK